MAMVPGISDDPGVSGNPGTQTFKAQTPNQLYELVREISMEEKQDRGRLCPTGTGRALLLQRRRRLHKTQIIV